MTLSAVSLNVLVFAREVDGVKVTLSEVGVAPTTTVLTAAPVHVTDLAATVV